MSDARSEISSFEEVESLASSDAEVQVSPLLRRYSYERAAAVSMAAHKGIPAVDKMRPSISRLRRPVATPAQSAAPESFDRLRQLKTHMKQLQKLYDEELHLEELARRDAFLQMMCTSSITLFRHCASRSRFYTAVKALMCQYLPARNAKLIQVERSNEKSYLVLQNNQSFQIAEGDSMGMAGNAVNAMQLANDRNKYAQDLSASSGSSVVSLARTSEGLTYSSHWLETHEDRILPSSSGHLLLLLPLRSIHQTDLHHEIDLLPKKKDVDDEAQLLVMGLKNANGTLIGIVEAILSDALKCNVELLDAFGALLATALESRLGTCRSVVENVHIRFIDYEREFAEREGSAVDLNDLQSRQPILTVPLLNNVGRIEAFGEASIFPEHDQDLLQAFQQPVSHLFKLNREFRGRSLVFENSLCGLHELWTKWASSAKLSESSKWKLLRELVLDFGKRIVESTRLKANEPSFQFRLLFRGETKDMYRCAYGDSVDSESDDPGRNVLFSIDGQFAILQQAIISNESFESGETVVVTPIRCRSDWAGEREMPNASQAIASMILILPNLSIAESSESQALLTTTKQLIFPLVIHFMEHALMVSKQLDHVESMLQRVEVLSEEREMLTVRLGNEQTLNDILKQFSACKSLEELVRCANAMPATIPVFGSKLPNVTLFMASFTASDGENTCSSITSFWTIAGTEANQCEKTELVGEQSGNGKPASGIPNYVALTQEPMSYTKDHHAFTTRWQEFSLSRYEYDYFYAVPLNAGKSEPVAVLEFAFESETQRMDFLANSCLRDSVINIVSYSITRLQHFSEKESRACQELDSRRELHEQVLSKWIDFVAEWSTLPLDGIGTWKRAVGPLLHRFLPTCDFVNIYSADENCADSEGAIIGSILKEVSVPPHSSRTLNVVNQAILQTCIVFPLARKMGPNEGETIQGLIAFSKQSDEPFTSEEQQFGLLMSSLLSSQVALFNDKCVTEGAIASMEKQLLEQLETLKHVEERNKCVLNECQRTQILLQVSRLCSDNLISSVSAEQFCEAVNLATTKSVSLAVNHTGENAVDGDLMLKMCFLLWDAHESSFRLVTSDPGNQHHVIIRVSEMESDIESNSPCFSKNRVRVHNFPFAKLPPRLLQALDASGQDPAFHSISLAPIINSDDPKEALFGLLAFATGADFDATNDFLLEIAECVYKTCKFKRDCEVSSAASKQLQDNVCRLEAKVLEEKLSNQVFTLAHELWVQAMIAPITDGGRFDEWKSRIRHLFTESFIQTFQDIVNLTSVELVVGSGADDVFSRSDTTKLTRSDESTFTKQLEALNQDGPCILGRLHAAWKLENTTLEGHKFVAHLEWLSDFLQSLLSYCLSVEEVRRRGCQSETQCLTLMNQLCENTTSLTRMEQERRRWVLLHEAVMASAVLLKTPREIDCVDNLVEPSSPWHHLFSAIEIFSDRNMKLWLTSNQHEHLWTVVDGKMRTWSLALPKKKLPRSFVTLTFAEPIAEACGLDASASRPLGYLEVVKPDMEDDMLVTQLIATITTTLHCRKQASQIQCLEEHAQRVETTSNEHTRAWKQHSHFWSTRLLSVQTRVKAWASKQMKNAQPVSKSEDCCSELLRLVENSLHERDPSPRKLRHIRELIQFRTYLRIEQCASYRSSLIRSCKTDCKQCSSLDTLKMLDELGAHLQERDGMKTLTLDLSAGASNEVSCRGSDHPALSLVHSNCEANHPTSWRIISISGNDEEMTTHRLLAHIIDRSIPTIGAVQLVFVAVMEKSDLIDDSSADFAFRLCEEFVLDALSTVHDGASTREATDSLNRELLSTAKALTDSSRDRAAIEDLVKEVGCAFHEAVVWKDGDPKLHKIVGSILSKMTGSPVQAHICLRSEALCSGRDWNVIGGASDIQAHHELIQSVQSVIGNATSQDEQLSCIRLHSQSKGDAFRFFYRLFDANHAEIGVLVLDTGSDLSLLAERGFDSVFVFTRQLVSAVIAVWRENKAHADQTQSLCEEREQLILEKSQLELNSLEMKNLLHRNEVNLVTFRNHVDSVLCSTSKLVDSYLADLEAIELPKQVLAGLGSTISAMENIRGVHFNLLSKKACSDPPLFTSIMKAEDKRIIRSDEVKEAIRACIKQSETITVRVNEASSESQEREHDLKVALAKGVESVIVFPVPVAVLEEIDPASEADESKDVVKVSAETKAVLIVLVDQFNGASQSPGLIAAMHQIQQIKVLIRAAVVRCHTLVQSTIWKQQIALMTDKETNADHQLALLEHKCSQLQSKYDQRTQLYGGLTNQMSLALPALHSKSSKALRSKQLLEMWQHLTEIVKGRLGSAFRECKFVRQGGFHLFGAAAEGNFFFSISGSPESFGEKQFQFSPIQAPPKDATHQALRKAFVSESIVEEAQEDAKRGIDDVSIYIPMIGATQEDQGQEHVVGILKVRCESSLDYEEKETLRDFLTWFAPTVRSIGLMLHRKLHRKQALCQQQPARAVDICRSSGISRQSVDAGNSSQLHVGRANSGLLPGYSAPLLSNPAGDIVGQGIKNTGHGKMDTVYDSVQENGDEDEDDGDDEGSVNEGKIRRRRRDALLPGIIALLIKVQETTSLRTLKVVVQRELKALWSFCNTTARTKIFDCQLYSQDDLLTEQSVGAALNNAEPDLPVWVRAVISQHKMRDGHLNELAIVKGADPTSQHQSEEQFWLLSMSDASTDIREPITNAAYSLVIRGSYLDEVFDVDDEQVHLLQIARCIRRQISQLSKANATQSQVSQLCEAKTQASSLAVKSRQLEQTVSDMSSFAEFVSALSGVESERALSNLVMAYLKKLLVCDRVTFQLMHSSTMNIVDELDRVVRGEHNDSSLDEAIDVAATTLEMDNILRLRISSPYHDGSGLSAVCVARMGSMAAPLNAQKQDLLRQVAPIIGSALHRIRSETKVNRQLCVIASAQSEIDRLVAEKEELQKQRQHQLQAHDDFQLRLGDQNALAAESKRLEAQLSEMASKLEAYARETSEQQSVLVARDKTITQLSFELEQSAKVAAELRYMEEENAERQQRETKLKKKILKQRLQLKNLVSELGSLKQKESFNQHEISQLQRQIATMSERQQQASATVKSSSTRRSQSSRLYDQMQQQIQRRKQLNLAQELRQLAAMEVREMKVRNREQREKSQHFQTQMREEKRSA